MDQFDDWRRATVLSIAVLVVIAGWLATWSALHEHHLEALLVALILLTGGLGSIRLRAHHLPAASYLLTFSVIVSITCEKGLFPGSLAQYYFPLAVVISSLLVIDWNVFLVGLLASAACVTLARLRGVGWLDPVEMLTPNILIQVTAVASWLSARQVLIALEWTQSHYTRARDLLEQLRDERASLASTIKMLEDAYLRIAKMNYALIEARSMAEESRQIKAEFAANVSHELRTPLNIIIGFSETMANAPETYTGVTWSPHLRSDIEQIYQSSRHLSSLIDDILDLSALEVNRLGLTLVETNIQTVIDEALTVVQDLFKAKQLQLLVRIPAGLPILRIDATRIRQVLINLLTNASRFTAKGRVTITAQQVDQTIQVAVSDTGIGIAPADIPKVFEEFSQVDNSTRRHEGSGLGVPLSKRLVELHKGRMWLESQPGVGSTFYFTLPIAPEARAAARLSSAPSGAAAPAYRREVLLAEPDPLLVRTMRRHLSNFEVVEVKEYSELSALTTRHQPVALVVDKQKDRELASLQSSVAQMPPDLPMITLTLPGQLRSAQALGIQEFLVKPVLREQLLAKVEALGETIQTVLIGGDEPQATELLCRMLQSTGKTYGLIRALGPEEVLDQLKAYSVDLIILDLLIPSDRHLKILEAKKDDPNLAKIPLLVISSEYPHWIQRTEGLNLCLSRPQEATVGETLNYLEALLSALPLRGLPDSRVDPALPAAPADRPAS